MQGLTLLRSFDLAAAPFAVDDCFDLAQPTRDQPTGVPMIMLIRAGQALYGPEDLPNKQSGREVTVHEYELFRWLYESGVQEGESVLLCWPGRGYSSQFMTKRT